MFIELTQRIFDWVKYHPDGEYDFNDKSTEFSAIGYNVHTEQSFKKIMINPKYIRHFHNSKDNFGSTIVLKYFIYVQESYDEICKKLKAINEI